MDLKIFDSLLEPVFVLNSQKQVIYCNEAAVTISDVSARKIQRAKMTLEDIFKFSDPVHFLQNLSALTDPSPYQEVRFTVGADRSGRVQLTAQKINQIDDQDAWLVYFRDVTLEETLQKKYKAEQAELERYSKNLEIMVAERTVEVRKLNQTMSALLDSLGQGFFLFAEDGSCSEVYSKACLHTIESSPAGRKIWDVLKLREAQVPGFKKWMTTLFSEMLPFEDLSPLGPPNFEHSQERKIQLEYYPLRSPQGKIEAVVVVSTDITELVAAQLEAQNEKAHAQMIISLVQQKRHIQGFIQESKDLLSQVRQEFDNVQTFSADNLFRCLHTLKGGAATFSIKPLVEQAHLSENLLSQWKSKNSEESFAQLRQNSLEIEKKFNDFINENESILGSADKLKNRWVEFSAESLWDFQKRLPPQLQQQFIETFLMEPIHAHFSQYNEVIRSIADREGKLVNPLKLQNSDLPVLPEIYSQLFSTLVHAFRNAVDHGIESPDVRQELGKSPAGSIEVSFAKTQDSGRDWLEILIKDDGGGIDPEKIRQGLKNKGVETNHESDEVVIQHVFDSQFSTRTDVTETSGRGVGMDAILHAAQKLNGQAWVTSQVGTGTCLMIKVPYIHQMTSLKRAA